uniref:Uncharacterized protein n=1 Tax=Oryza sativa subsp. japonica TaxID=39947 RepID=Q5VPV5_ORYSJ|nr:hypothetical protein [Oryza sativa Japonica Group]
MGGAIWMRWCQSHELHVAPLAAGAQMSDTPATRCCADGRHSKQEFDYVMV